MGNKKLLSVYRKSSLKKDAANLGLPVFALITARLQYLSFKINLARKIIKKSRGYLHFDLRISKANALKTTFSAKQIEKHQFYPLIKFEKIERKYKRNKKTPGLNTIKIKTRDIYYASHRDALIYTWYSVILERRYEDFILTEDFKDCIIAYRKLDHKSNIDFAKDVFENIKSRNSCLVITIDIKHFFDQLDHKLLKDEWKNLLEVNSLSTEHYKIFRSVTSFAYVNLEKLYKEFGIKKKNPLLKICSAQEFRSRVVEKSLIKVNRSHKGIPQGTPISAILSNVYMLSFDKKILNKLQPIHGFYRRYSDDIVIVCDTRNQTKILDMLKGELHAIKLKLNPKKTNIVVFKKNDDDKLMGYSTKGQKKNLQYLGFDFDGKNYFIRSSSISRYYRKAKAVVKLYSKIASKNPHNKYIYKKNLYERFTHLGKRNFISYAATAGRKMDSNNIRKQIKNHMKNINLAIKKHTPGSSMKNGE